jgi:hypothetical protein
MVEGSVMGAVLRCKRGNARWSEWVRGGHRTTVVLEFDF